jgi:outer membrane protein assembly factor BamB
MAYDAASGERRWSRSYDGHNDPGNDVPTSVAVSPDGSTVFVTGVSAEQATGKDFATVAWDAATGDRRWVARYDGAGLSDVPLGMTLSSDGSTVYVTGSSYIEASGRDYLTVAYDAEIGVERWTARTSGPERHSDIARSVAATAGAVFVTGTLPGIRGAERMVTIAYDPPTGDELWRSVRTGFGWGNVVVASADGSAVYAVGHRGIHADYLTVALEATTGEERWTQTYDGTSAGWGYDETADAALSPSGDVLVVTGTSEGRRTPDRDDYATVAYDAASGHRRWVARYDGSLGYADSAEALAIDPAGTAVYVTGSSGFFFQSDYATLAYDLSSGDLLWVRRLDGQDGLRDRAGDVVAGPAAVYVAGFSMSERWREDFLTIAYASR